jgi:methyl-accepting chemotaxis protein
MFKNITIRARLIISSVVFLIPLGGLLFINITNFNKSIRAAQLERQGLACLRSVTELFRLSFEQIRSFSRERGPGSDAPQSRQRLGPGSSIAASLADLEEACRPLLDSSAPRRAAPEGAGELLIRIRGAFAILETAKGGAELTIYAEIVRDLRALASLAGSGFSLILEQEAVGYYLVDAIILALPQSLERIFLTGNLLRRARVWGVFPGNDRALALEYLSLLGNADYPLALKNTEAALACLKEEGRHEEETAELYPLLASYRSAIEDFIFTLRTMVSLLPEELAGTPGRSAPVPGGPPDWYAGLQQAESLAAEESCRLMSASLTQLELLLDRRIGTYQDKRIRFLVSALVVWALFFLIVFMINITIAGNIRQFKSLFKALKHNDLSVRTPAKSGDELGELMAAFNGFLEQLNAALVSFTRDISTVSSAAFDLSTSAREISTIANGQSSSVAEILSAMEGNKELSAQGAAATQEVAELADRTRELSRRGADLRDANQDMMSRIRDQNGKIIDEIQGLADMLARINESIAIIDSIADQTKLIAFNAGLEAAASVTYNGGGGEDNARFAVVAAEIRRFAGNVVDSTAEIKEQIQEVQQASQALIEEADDGRRRIDQGYDRMVRQKEVFEEIVEVSRNVADRSRQISTISKQQEYASAQIFIALKEISAGVNEFVSATGTASRIADSLKAMSVELKDVLRAYRIVSPQGQAQEEEKREWQIR